MKRTQSYSGLICPLCNFSVDDDSGYCFNCECAGIRDIPAEKELDFENTGERTVELDVSTDEES